VNHQSCHNQLFVLPILARKLYQSDIFSQLFLLQLQAYEPQAEDNNMVGREENVYVVVEFFFVSI